jgi:hypothetical protein
MTIGSHDGARSTRMLRFVTERPVGERASEHAKDET